MEKGGQCHQDLRHRISPSQHQGATMLRLAQHQPDLQQIPSLLLEMALQPQLPLEVWVVVHLVSVADHPQGSPSVELL